MRHWDWIFFDLDGTLVDSLPAMRDAYFGFLRTFSIAGTHQEFNSLNGPSMPEVILRLKSKYRLRESESSLRTRYFAAIREAYASRVMAFPGANRLLKRLKREGVRTALVSASLSHLAKPLIRRLGWSEHFDLEVYGDFVKRGKPNPALYRLAVRRSGADPRRVLAVEDSANGVIAARRAGLTVAGMGTGAHVKRLRILGASNVFSGIQKFESFLLSSSGRNFSKMPVDVPLRLVNDGPRPPYRGPGLLFCVESVSRVSGRLEIRGRYRRYETYVKSAKSKTNPLQALGVSGVSRADSKAGGRYLIGRRGGQVRHYKHKLEFVPSGGVDAACARSNGTVDYQRQLKREFVEETGVKADRIKRIRPFALLHDAGTHTYDICCEILLNGMPEPSEFAGRSKEYGSLRWIGFGQVRRLMKRKRDLVPATAEAIELYQKIIHKEAS